MRKISEIAAWSVAIALIAYALWGGLTALNWDVIIKGRPRLSEGALLTLELVAIAVLAGLILALPMGIARASRHWYVRALPYGYIFFFRGTPLLVQLFLVYYGLAQFDAVREGPLWPYLLPVLVRGADHDHAHRRLYRRNSTRSDSGRATGRDRSRSRAGHVARQDHVLYRPTTRRAYRLTCLQ